MKLDLPYGRGVLGVELPDDTHVLLPSRSTALAVPEEAVRLALRRPLNSPPLRDLLSPHNSVAIVISDITRPVPNRVLLPPVLETIAAAGVPRERVVVINGTGMHRANTREELASMLGEDVVREYRIVNHDARDPSTLGRIEVDGEDFWLNREYLEAGVKVLTGFVEPHIFAGYSGGGKAALPGLAGAETVLKNHGVDMLSHPRATWCCAEGNPIFEQVRRVALATAPAFIVNVTLNERKEITGVFAGELAAAHDAAIAQAAAQALTTIPHLYDVVVATNMGWPADINLYQSMKAMSVAAQAVRPGGAIVLAAECAEGLGNDDFSRLLTSERSFPALMEKIRRPGFAADEQWGVQCIAMVAEKADIYVHSCLPRDVIEGQAHLRHSEDVTETVRSLLRAKNGGRKPSVAALPHGQLTVPRLQR
ncbi:MAG: nickel-dependent lactate racemase [Dehalococcoidia bacterium]|nr:nickel-dependent lactate racemase [Dehalococcoidia bacterium]